MGGRRILRNYEKIAQYGSKKKHLLIAVMALVLVSFSSSAMAAGNATVTVDATVVGTCQWITIAGALDLGNLTVGDIGPIAAATQPDFWCTQGAAYTITDDDGLNESGPGAPRLTDGGGNFIDYSYTYTAGGFGGGPLGTITMDFNASVLEADYAAQPAGGYSDSVLLTISP